MANFPDPSEPSHTPLLPRKPQRFAWLAGALVALLLAAAAGTYTWFYGFNACEVGDVETASDFLVIQLKQYDDVYASAASGTRTSLTYPITVMQQILVDTQQVDVPACMQTARTELIGYMGTAIRALQAFVAGEADHTIRELVARSNAHYDNFYSEMDAANECAPYCLP